MDIAAERNFGLARGAASGHILYGSVREERQSARPKGLQPVGFRQKEPGDSVAPQSQILKDMLLRRALSAGSFWRNSNIHSFLTGC